MPREIDISVGGVVVSVGLRSKLAMRIELLGGTITFLLLSDHQGAFASNGFADNSSGSQAPRRDKRERKSIKQYMAPAQTNIDMDHRKTAQEVRIIVK